VLLHPLTNRDEDRLLYVRQSAPGIGSKNSAFSIPEIDDLSTGLKTITELGTFSAVDFTVVGLGSPREIPAGVVDGHYFEVMGLRPVLGRLLMPADDGPNAAGAIVLTYRFWTAALLFRHLPLQGRVARFSDSRLPSGACRASVLLVCSQCCPRVAVSSLPLWRAARRAHRPAARIQTISAARAPRFFSRPALAQGDGNSSTASPAWQGSGSGCLSPAKCWQSGTIAVAMFLSPIPCLTSLVRRLSAAGGFGCGWLVQLQLVPAHPYFRKCSRIMGPAVFSRQISSSKGVVA
jgi:hypothetical protein